MCVYVCVYVCVCMCVCMCVHVCVCGGGGVPNLLYILNVAAHVAT